MNTENNFPASRKGFLTDTLKSIKINTIPNKGYRIFLEITSNESKHYLTLYIADNNKHIIFTRKVACISNYEGSIYLFDSMANTLLEGLSRIIPIGYIIEDNVITIHKDKTAV
ncbi:hypothetical protein [Bacillus sp. mrc49]|uniref:hypothetical protein n=1 Tax=Bacillus sp. mrc49 TaxID=2054913 RepID=UPI000C26E1F0|nr:hypothetical protein [Bacillus sp. mrc49]PJN90606.1 hypothetical protein CVN76_09420 [Bacillus sp. mrc49]